MRRSGHIKSEQNTDLANIRERIREERLILLGHDDVVMKTLK